MMLLLGVVVGMVALCAAGDRCWRKFQLKHLVQVAFDPLRTLVTYSQVTSQLGGVLLGWYP